MSNITDTTIDNDNLQYMLSTAIDRINDGVVIVDSTSKIIYVNDAYSKILHVNKEKVLDKFIRDIEPGAVILDVLKSKTQKLNTVVTVKTLGKRIAVSINTIMAGEQLVGAISVFKDITEILLLNEELQQVRELTGYFYKKSSHNTYDLPESFSPIVGKNEKFIQRLKLASIVAPTEATVLIEGESGAGKEVFVNAILSVSGERKKPFVEINCSAIPENLFESELFGYTGGSFTGAQRGGKAGKFEMADTGTIFLDEIGEMPLFMQSKLLRVLQSGEIQKIGADRMQRVNVRIIAATNQNLKKMVQAGNFREDLYFRLNTFKIVIPPLRERGNDILLLAQYFMDIYGTKYHKQVVLSKEAEKLLMDNAWVGNVRQLQSCIEYAVIICQGTELVAANFPEEIQHGLAEEIVMETKESQKNLKNTICAVERDRIIRELIATKGNKTQAMKNIGISRRTFYRKLALYHIDSNMYTK